MATIAELRETKRRHMPSLMKRRNVVAVGIGRKVSSGQETGDLAVVVSVTRKEPAEALKASDLVPRQIDGVVTDVVEVGELRTIERARLMAEAATDRLRPAPAGCSIGHFSITAGTLGLLVARTMNRGKALILSNNHVMAASGEATEGDNILQPGAHDGGQNPRDALAQLIEFVPITFDGDNGGGGNPGRCPVGQAFVYLANLVLRRSGFRSRLQLTEAQATPNYVDAALALPTSPDVVTPEILNLGPWRTDPAGAVVGMPVQKFGRTTGHTRDTVKQVDVTARVQYGAGRVATFEDQFMAGPMSQGGDSGSCVLDNDKRPVGLLFAGSDQVTLCNRWARVAEAFGIVPYDPEG